MALSWFFASWDLLCAFPVKQRSWFDTRDSWARGGDGAGEESKPSPTPAIFNKSSFFFCFFGFFFVFLGEHPQLMGVSRLVVESEL